MSPPLITDTARGLYCTAGDFYIDAAQPVPRTLITHAHGDHAHVGSGTYLCAAACEPLLRRRFADATIQAVPFGETIDVGGVRVSFHPARHILGSAQIRLEHA